MNAQGWGRNVLIQIKLMAGDGCRVLLSGSKKIAGERLPGPGVLLGQQLGCLRTFRRKEMSSSSESGPLTLGGTLCGQSYLSVLEDCIHSPRAKVRGQRKHLAEEHC